MSTVKAINLQHPTAANANIVLDNAGDVGMGANPDGYRLRVRYDGTYAARIESNQLRTALSFSDSGTTESIGPSIASSGNSLTFGMGGLSFNEFMKIDSSGRVTKPYQPCWLYTGGTGLTNNTDVVTKPGNAVISSSSYNTSTGLFTAPVAGKYLVGLWGLLYPHNSSVITAYFIKNGSSYGQAVQGGWSGSNHTTYNASMLVNLAVNDTIGFVINRSTGSDGVNAYGGQWNQWGYLLG